MRKTILRGSCLAAVLGLLAGCGDTPVERGLSGAAIGAGVAVAANINPVAGLLVGGAAGVAVQ